PVGGNVTRLAALTAGPLVAAALGPRRPLVLAALAVPLVYWQAMPPIRDVAVAAGDPSTRADYYAPLVAAIERDRGGDRSPIRIEVPFTRAQWEAARLAPRVALARGWQRQLDRERNALFYDGTLTTERYEAWLRENGIAYVAVPDVALDDSARAEAALVTAGVPGLDEVWRDEHWRLYRVAARRDGEPLGVTALGPDGFTVRRSGDVRVRFSPHWAVVAGAGCVSEAPGGYTRVRLADGAAGPVRIGVRVDPWRALLGRTSSRCRDLPPGDHTVDG
ncbi:MAG TPA: hypothetical protein VFR97_05800, partial [Capillimicrobium sp.]|nr:hypothetical protein [Capillimicrobium sp.]